MGSDLLWGAKAVMRHLKEQWNYAIGRQRLWRLSRRKRDRFPLTVRIRNRRGSIAASKRDVDSWMKRNVGSVATSPTPATL